jgi:hypothetical protein
VTANEKTSAIPAAKLALYEKLIATDPSIERKGATIPYTSANGKMFTFLVHKDFVAVPAPLLARTSKLKPYLGISRACAERLGPKTVAKRRSPS